MAEDKIITAGIKVVKTEPKIKKESEYEEPEELYRKLVETIRRYHPSTDFTQIEQAYQMASKAHKGQKRRSGEEYIIHPLSVAIILAELELDKESIIAGILHDVVEDTDVTLEDVRKEFGDEVALLVDGVTKLTKLSYSKDKVEVQAVNLRKMFLAMAKDIRVIVVKLADRLHNMRTLEYMNTDKQEEKSRETMDIYAPLADRLGISRIKIELDDLSLKYLEPEKYAQIEEERQEKFSQGEEGIRRLVTEIESYMKEAQIHAHVYGRMKHIFSVYKKMVTKHKSFDQILDLFAVRIIVDDVKDCYMALGIIHDKYNPIQGRFKDYIAMPKPNNYQSLHTTLIAPSGQPFEVQIRTMEMHRIAEYGIAAHWKYKEDPGGKLSPGTAEAKLSWLRQILEWQMEMPDNQEFMTLIKDDLNLFSEDVYCFTPTGDVINLPTGSTPIDFAYSIHSAVGNRMVGARVNGKLVPIDYEIQNGDQIEIVTSQNTKGPSRDWLKIVKSTQAKNKINQWFKGELREENIVRGKNLMDKYCKTKGISLGDITKAEYVEKVLRKYSYKDWDSLMAAVGHGAMKEVQVVNRLYEEYEKNHKKIITNEQILEELSGNKEKKYLVRSKSGITVKGVHDVSVRFSKCCNPVPGDEIVGFITRGRGISIHRTDCINILNLPELERNRMIPADWEIDSIEGKTGEKYNCEIRIFANNRIGLLSDISRIFTENDIDVRGINCRTSKQEVATISVSFLTNGKAQMVQMVDKLRSVEGVLTIERTAS